MSKPANVYIDGFNLYFGALKHRPQFKWLDLNNFAQTLQPHREIGQVYYFTADIHREHDFDEAPARQAAYLKVLADSGVEIVKGHFSHRQKNLRLVGESGPESKLASVWQYEEKGSDVNLASYLLRDVYVSNLTHAVIVSGDSDLSNALKFASEAGTHISLAIPDRHENGSSKLKAVAHYVQFVKSSQLESSQFPHAVILNSGREIIRPKGWT
jgi:uncharacterized LabA/DUF88 family protein